MENTGSAWCILDIEQILAASFAFWCKATGHFWQMIKVLGAKGKFNSCYDQFFFLFFWYKFKILEIIYRAHPHPLGHLD